MGPITSTLIRKYSQNSGSLTELCQKLAAEIPNEGDRHKFLKACKTDFGRESLGDLASDLSRATTPVPPGSKAGVWDPAMLERARKDLAEIIGPLAKVIVNKAAKQARTLAEFHDLITADLSTKDRERFLASR